MMNDLSRTRRQWERHRVSPDISQGMDWTRGVAYGLRLAMQVFKRHLNSPETLRGQSRTPYHDSRNLN